MVPECESWQFALEVKHTFENGVLKQNTRIYGKSSNGKIEHYGVRSFITCALHKM
jgi:hypothetical protein